MEKGNGYPMMPCSNTRILACCAGAGFCAKFQNGALHERSVYHHKIINLNMTQSIVVQGNLLLFEVKLSLILSLDVHSFIFLPFAYEK